LRSGTDPPVSGELTEGKLKFYQA